LGSLPPHFFKMLVELFLDPARVAAVGNGSTDRGQLDGRDSPIVTVEGHTKMVLVEVP